MVEIIKSNAARRFKIDFIVDKISRKNDDNFTNKAIKLESLLKNVNMSKTENSSSWKLNDFQSSSYLSSNNFTGNLHCKLK